MAAVDKIEDQRKPEDFIGHRNRDVLGKEKPPTFVGGYLVFALPIFTARAIYRPGVATVQWTVAARI